VPVTRAVVGRLGTRDSCPRQRDLVPLARTAFEPGSRGDELGPSSRARRGETERLSVSVTQTRLRAVPRNLSGIQSAIRRVATQ